ncbi:MAG: carbohydrate-binding protein [Acetobacteraceae bacterium]
MATAAAWKIGQAYAVGDLVTYLGVTYRALQAANAIESWNPVAAPALWSVVSGSATPVPEAAQPAESGTWSAAAVYTQGMTVTIGDVTYRANWWTQGTDPTRNNGTGGSGQPWTIVAAAPTPAPPPVPVPDPTPQDGATSWAAGTVYIAGMTATVAGVTYKANWWTRGDDPTTHNGATGTGQPWTIVRGAASPASTIPGVPTDLAATGTTTGTTVLTWRAASGSVTDYAVYRDGQRIGTTTGTSFTVTGLSAATSYAFSVLAENTTGASARSADLTVTTRQGGTVAPATTHVFAPYIDLSLYLSQNLGTIQATAGVTALTLAFVLDAGNGQVGWGGTGSIAADGFPNGTSVQEQVRSLQARGVDITISFGGANGAEPALVASGAGQLQAAYQSVIDRYGVTSLDFDIEGAAVSNQASLALRDQALIGLRAANPGLEISFTLPVLPTGLDANGLNVLATAQRDGLTPDVVNIMAMDYGPAVDNGGQMGVNAISAALATLEQLAFLGMDSRIGITPMIGVNDVASEVFTLADAQSLVDFAHATPQVERLSMWSLSRDNGSTAGAAWASPTGSGLSQTDYAFSKVFETF